MLVRQPAAGLEQATKPLLHAGAQTPPPQVDPEAFCVKHCVPQPPQLAGSAAVGVSQPLIGFPSQLAWFAAQVGTQVLAVHTLVVVAALATHTVPHAPQLAASVAVEVSQPFLGFPSQLA